MRQRPYLVFLDPGHGGADPGAVNETHSIKESDLALRLALALKAKAEKGDFLFRVALTREDDSLVSLEARCVLANIMKADCFVSLHYNAAENELARGHEVWTTVGFTKADILAVELLTALAAAMPFSVGRFDYDDGDPDKEKNFYVLRHTKMPAALVEVEFLSNDSIAPALAEEKLIDRLAAELADSIETFLEG